MEAARGQLSCSAAAGTDIPVLAGRTARAAPLSRGAAVPSLGGAVARALLGKRRRRPPGRAGAGRGHGLHAFWDFGTLNFGAVR